MCHTYHMNPLTTNEPLIILNHSSFWTRDSPKAHWPQGGNNANNTNIFKYTDLTDLCSRRCAHMRNESHEYIYFAHGSHGSHGSANASHGSRISFLICHLKHNKSITTTSQQPQWINNHNESITTTSCHSQRAEGSKSVRSVRSVCQKTFVLFVKFVFKKKSRVQTSRAQNPWDLWDPCAKKHSCYSNYSCSKKI